MRALPLAAKFCFFMDSARLANLPPRKFLMPLLPVEDIDPRERPAIELLLDLPPKLSLSLILLTEPLDSD